MTARTLLQFWEPLELRGDLIAAESSSPSQMLSSELAVVDNAASCLVSPLKDFRNDACWRKLSMDLRRGPIGLRTPPTHTPPHFSHLSCSHSPIYLSLSSPYLPLFLQSVYRSILRYVCITAVLWWSNFNVQSRSVFLLRALDFIPNAVYRHWLSINGGINGFECIGGNC